MLVYLGDLLRRLGLNEKLAELTAVVAIFVAILIVAALANLIAKRLILRAVNYFVARTETKWDDYLSQRRVFGRLSHLAPAVVIYLLVPLLLSTHSVVVSATIKLAQIYMIIVGVLVLASLLDAIQDIYRTFETAKQVPVKGFVQVVKVVLFGVGGIIVLAILLDKTPLYLLSGLGALTAVLLIVFKDPILGFVGGIQLSANEMVAIGDWIEMPSHNADGDVIEVALTTVKVQNWDKTITTIPTYDLISRPFKNWRGMKETGGRRIKRSIYIDMNSIRFCDNAMLARFSKFQLIREYLDGKSAELAKHNEEVDEASPVNSRRLTNIGTFRAYVIAYLRAHPKIHGELTFLVRQLAPTENGLPIQIYVFVADTVWANYEGVQADIFDHLLAVLPEFDLRVFQNPTGEQLSAALAVNR